MITRTESPSFSKPLLMKVVVSLLALKVSKLLSVTGTPFINQVYRAVLALMVSATAVKSTVSFTPNRCKMLSGHKKVCEGVRLIVGVIVCVIPNVSVPLILCSG